ncbi:acyltransferase [Novosphingobium sp. TH158]|uniref:acyltransferase family protein n=1 Tax=Novosphingobium sp. TH158 TaxID=2067455 RepID=UPI000C79CAF7|nr:acyltransferase [Novosphingobium sp. TH158]PLK24242.1 hypothetical protein C0V78_13270 [Novosphingobium sp. TH158]
MSAATTPAPRPSAPFPARMATLDALRGTAAILVMLDHMDNWFPGLALLPMPGGYLAVDLFFVLSGFVLARAYEPRFAAGLQLDRFVRLRLARVWPMAGLAALFAVLVHGAHPAMALLVPDFRSAEGLFPANPPMWSLLFELLVNVAWGAIALHLSNRALGALVAASGLALWSLIPSTGLSEIGAFWSTAGAGLVRTLFSFSLGIALYRLHARHGTVRVSPWIAWLAAAALVAALAFDPARRGLWDALCVFVILPALVWLGACHEMPQRRTASALGDLSYPLYCIHVPLLVLLPENSGAIAAGTLGLIALAWALDRWFDRPLRALLTGWISRPARIRPASA